MFFAPGAAWALLTGPELFSQFRPAPGWITEERIGWQEGGGEAGLRRSLA